MYRLLTMHLLPLFFCTEPTATFYVWADISGLKEPLNDSLVFLEECLKRKVICVVRLKAITVKENVLCYFENLLRIKTL